MTWWMWVLLWGVLLLGSAGVLGWCGLRVFRSGVRLGRAFGDSADRAAAAQSTAPTLSEGKSSTGQAAQPLARSQPIVKPFDQPVDRA